MKMIDTGHDRSQRRLRSGVSSWEHWAMTLGRSWTYIFGSLARHERGLFVGIDLSTVYQEKIVAYCISYS